jgi:hypothetical protein
VEHRADVVIAEETPVAQQAYKFDVQIGPDGKVELQVPIPAGTRVEVLVIAPEADEFEDLTQAAQSSTGFWDNPLDDEDWNDA